MPQTYTINNPAFAGAGAQQIKIPVPEEGELFRSGDTLNLLRGGQLYRFDPGEYYEQNLKSTTPVTNRGQLESAVYGNLGVDINKLPEYNFGDVMQWYQGQQAHAPGQPLPDINKLVNTAPRLAVGDIKSLYGTAGNFSAPGKATSRPLSGAEAPPLITGAQGPVTATGQKITPDQYAQYGIQDRRVTPPLVDPARQVQAQNAPTQAQTSPYGEYVPNPSYLSLYNENEITRDPSGRIYLKPGVPKRWQQPQAPVPGAPTPKGQLIPSPDFLRYYRENEIERGPDGRIYLKQGVPVRWGQAAAAPGVAPTEQVSPGAAPEVAGPRTAAEDLAQFDLELQGIDTNIAEDTPYGDIVEKYGQALQQIMAPQTDAQNAVLQELLNRPKMSDELAQLEEQQGIAGVQERITELSQAALPLETALRDLPDNIVKRYEDIGLNTAQVARRLALESKDLSETLNNIANQQGILQNDLVMRREAVDRLLKATEIDREDRLQGLQTGLEMIQSNIAQQKELMDLQMELTVNNIEREQAKQDAIEEEDRRFNQELQLLTIKESLKSGGGYDDDSISLAQTVLENPELFNQLTATEKGKIAPILYDLGFTNFGKPLSDTAIKEITQTETAIDSLNDLKEIINSNLEYVGPISGLQALNPFSPARKVQADIDRVRQVVGKALEGGVLRKEDEEKYKKILATLTDTPETALYKINQLITDLQRNVSTYKNNQILSGKNVSETINSSSLPPLNKSYSSLDALTKDHKEYIDLVDQLGQQFPNATDNEILKLIEKSTFNNDLSRSGNFSSDSDKVAEAIGQFESGNNYSARGPVVQSGQYKGERAMGRYQVMPGNLPQWSRQALGRVVTEREFMDSPKLQDSIARYKIGELYNKYGTLEDTASAWFTGQPLAKAGNVSDVLGTTAPQYVKNIRSIYNRLG